MKLIHALQNLRQIKFRFQNMVVSINTTNKKDCYAGFMKCHNTYTTILFVSTNVFSFAGHAKVNDYH